MKDPAGLKSPEASERFISAAHAALDNSWREFDELYRAVAASFGLSESAWDILYVLYMAGDEAVSQRRIQKEMCLGKQTVNSSVHKLAREGSLTMERAGRESIVRLTEKGHALVRHAVVPVVEAEEAALRSMGEKECSLMIDYTQRYLRCLREHFSRMPGSRHAEPSPDAAAKGGERHGD